MSRTSRLAVLVMVFLLAWFGTLDYRKLVKPDEGRYAEIPREMVASGDWLTPRLNDLKYFEKPPLQYWATATAFTAFGDHEWTARLWAALTGLFSILFAAYAAAQLWGRSVGWHTAAVLAGSLLYVLISHINTLDMGVSFFLSGAIFAFVLAQRDEATARQTRNWMWTAWALLGLAVLSKGLIGLALPGATLVAYTLWQRDFGLWKKLHLLSGLAILLAITAPWFIAVSLANPEFFHFFFIHEHFERFLTKAHGRYQPIWYFVPILGIGLLPWTTLAIPALARAIRRTGDSRFQPQRFLLVWIVVVFGFFSVSSSKLASYILPLFPAVAALIAGQLALIGPRRLRWHAAPLIPLALAGAFLAPGAMRFATAETPVELYAAYVPWLIAACLALAAGSALAFVIARRGSISGATLSLAAGGLMFALLALNGHESLAPSGSAGPLIQGIREPVPAGVPFYTVDTFDHTVPFYLKRTLTMVGYRDELGHGIAHEPHKFIENETDFEQRWRSDGPAWAIMNPAGYARWRDAGLPMELVARDTRRIIVRKPL